MIRRGALSVLVLLLTIATFLSSHRLPGSSTEVGLPLPLRESYPCRISLGFIQVRIRAGQDISDIVAAHEGVGPADDAGLVFYFAHEGRTIEVVPADDEGLVYYVPVRQGEVRAKAQDYSSDDRVESASTIVEYCHVNL